MWAPRIGLTGPAAVGHIVRRALAQAGVRRSGRGAAHLFRHGLATKMIRHGASMAEIAEVLRHRSQTTTAIYAQVSFEALRAVALPWPTTGGAPMSALRDALTQYVALRRALGTQLQEPAMTLGHFVEFLEREGAEFITSELALRWAMEPKLVQRATWARRLGMVRRFASWLSTVDSRTEVPPRRLLAARRRRNKPHIFTEQEIVRLMEEAARLTSPTGLRAMTYVTLIGLLSATGLRPGEALALDMADVDLQSGILAIREIKVREVPLRSSRRLDTRRSCALCKTAR